MSSRPRLAPVPVTPARFSDLSEAANTQYFSVKDLLDRGKALAAEAHPPVPAVSQPPPPARAISMPSAAPPRPARRCALEQVRDASLARKATLVVLPLLLLLLALKPPFKKRASVAGSRPSAAVTATQKPHSAAAPVPEASPVEEVEQRIALAPGMTLQRVAVDSVTAGNFEQAFRAYRELARREPSNTAYAEAARILAARLRAAP